MALNFSYPAMYWLCVLICVFITGCGGGSDSDPSPANPNPPAQDNGWKVSPPLYEGLRTDFIISRENVSETVYSALESLDLANSLIFADENPHAYFMEYNVNTLIEEEPNCETGSFNEKVVEANRLIELQYENCEIEGTLANGTIRLVVSENKADAITDLTFIDLTTEEQFTITGYFSQFIGGRVLLNLMFESSDDEQLWFEELSLKNGHLGNSFGVTYNGNIYFSTKGKLSIRTLSTDQDKTQLNFVNTDIQILGDQTITVNAVTQNRLTFQYSENTLPIQISLARDEAPNFDDANQPPQANLIAQTSLADRTESVEFSALNSTDENFDPLAIDWQIVEQPDGANETLSFDGLGTGVLQSDRPGFYTIRVTVTDADGESSSSEQRIKIRRNKPNVELISATTTNQIGQPYASSFKILNDDLDGPFDYRLHYGPVGMEISQNGEVRWDGVMPDFSVDVDVNYGVYVQNEDRNTLIERSILMNSSGTTQKIINQPFHIGSYTFTSEAGEIYSNAQSSLSSVSLDSGKLMVEGKSAILFSANEESTFYTVAHDVNDDQIDDFFYVSWLDDSKTAVLGWLDGSTNLKTRIYEAELNFGQWNISLLDVDSNGERELYFKGPNSIYSFDLNSLELISTIENVPGEYVSTMCDFDVDGQNDLIVLSATGGVNRVSVVNPVTGVVIDEIERVQRFVDLNEGNACEWIGYKGEDLFYNTSSGTEVLLEEKHGFIFTGNFVASSQKQLLIIGETQATLIENIGTQQQQLSNYALSNDIMTLGDSFEFFYYAAVVDVDSDGIDEIMGAINNQTRLSNEQPRFSGYKIYSLGLTQSQLDIAYESDLIDTNPYQIISFSGDKALLQQKRSWNERFGTIGLTLNLDSAFPKSYISRPENVNGNARALIEQQVISFFDARNNSLDNTVDLNRYDQFGNTTWQSKPPMDFRLGQVSTIKIIDNRLLLLLLFDGAMLLDAQNGNEIIRSTGDSLSSGIYSEFAYFDELGGWIIVDDGRTGSVWLVKDNLVATELENPALNEMVDAAMNVSFTQMDDDPQLELIFYFSPSTNYRVFDVVTMQEQMANQQFTGDDFENFSITGPEMRISCVDWDIKCRNTVVNSMQGKRSEWGYQVRDKATGKIIWRFPRFKSAISDVDFYRNNNAIEAITTHYDGTIIHHK